jgi:hypothetical protein
MSAVEKEVSEQTTSDGWELLKELAEGLAITVDELNGSGSGFLNRRTQMPTTKRQLPSCAKSPAS